MTSQEFAGGCARQFRPVFDGSGEFVNGNVILQESFEFFEEFIAAFVTFFQYHKGLGDLSLFGIRNTHNTGFSNGRMFFNGFFNLGRPDTVTGTLDHVVLTGYKENIAVCFHEDCITHLVPAVDHTFFLGF